MERRSKQRTARAKAEVRLGEGQHLVPTARSTAGTQVLAPVPTAHCPQGPCSSQPNGEDHKTARPRREASGQNTDTSLGVPFGFVGHSEEPGKAVGAVIRHFGTEEVPLNQHSWHLAPVSPSFASSHPVAVG